MRNMDRWTDKVIPIYHLSGIISCYFVRPDFSTYSQCLSMV